MKTRVGDGDNWISFDESGLTLTLSRTMFRAEVWQRVLAWLEQRYEHGALLQAPFRVMTREEAHGPRWKQVGLDLLSGVVFALLIPPEHQLVQVWQTLEWEAINRLGADCYQNQARGQRAWAPAQMVALLLLMFLAPMLSERQLVQWVSQTPLYRWFCGFNLLSSLPDHSSLYTFRQRLGEERFEALLTWTVLRGQAAGLIGQELLHYDLTLVKASSRAWTPYQRAVILTQAMLVYLERSQTNPAATLSEAIAQVVAEVAVQTVGSKTMKDDPRTAGRVLQSRERWLKRLAQAKTPARWQLGVEQAVTSYLTETKTDPPAAPPVEPTSPSHLKRVAQRLRPLLPDGRGDLDARLGRSLGLNFTCGYRLGFLVDDRHDLITALQLVPANTAEQTLMLPALDQHRHRLGGNPRAVAADSAQDYYPVHHYLDQQQIEGHIAPRQRGTNDGLSSHHFVWDDQGHLHCPAGQVMTPRLPNQEGQVVFVTAVCPSCPQKTACLPKAQQPDGPRTLCLNPTAHQRLQQNREHAQTPAYLTAKKARFVREGLFGLARRLHHAQVMPYRSLPMNHIAGLFIAIVMNLLILRRHPPPT